MYPVQVSLNYRIFWH